ncbi:phenylalanine--tRNA ligase subunit beta [Gammaproteobacteria bacterium]|nr:phenylalanine--tRNA ligase subunit beta [Gammaproteobacteria bacterium]
MIISAQWLNELLQQSLSAQDIAEHLSSTGFESELLDDNVVLSDRLVVGEVKSVTAHPDATKLNVCQVDIGQEIVQIVCGCPTVKEAKYVIVAPVGTKLPKLEIKPVNLRGIESNGMICALGEIGFEVSQKGIFHIDEDVTVGQSIRDLVLTSQRIDVDITPNRGDCASACGIARDYAASANLVWEREALASNWPKGALVEIDTPAVINFSAARVLVDMRRSLPLAITQRLTQSGIKLINPVVDLLNYAMIYLGQPMHAYDASAVKLPLKAGFEAKKTTMKALDEVSYEIDTHDLVIKDQAAIVGLAGIIGSDATKVTDVTTEVVLESAIFDPKVLAKTLRQNNIQTDAAYRFERGVSPDLNEYALTYVLQMMERYLGARVVEVDCYRTQYEPKQVKTSVQWINQYLGTVISSEEMQSYLNRLGINTQLINDDLNSIIPPHRHDISESVDIAEEVARLYGYNRIPLSPMQTDLLVSSAKINQVSEAKKILYQLGMHEILTYSYTSEYLVRLTDKDANPFQIENPIHADFDLMRTHMWQTMLPVLQYNQSRQQHNIHLFEAGHVFLRGDGEPKESMVLAGLMSGQEKEKSYLQDERQVDYYDAQSIVHQLLDRLGYKALFRAVEHAVLHPLQAAEIVIESVVVGYVGRMHPILNSALEISEVYGFWVDMDKLPSVTGYDISLPSKYPSITRDLTLEFPEGSALGDVIRHWESLMIKDLHHIELLDCYHHNDVNAATFRFTFQSHSQTCADQDVQAAIDKLKGALYL